MSPKTDDAAPPELAAELVITLRSPVVLGYLEYSSVRLREPTAAEYRDMMRKSGVSRTLAAISAIAGIPPVAVGKIGARDLKKAQIYIDAFCESGADPADAGLEELDMPLRQAVDYQDVTYASLKLREPTGEDLVEIYSKAGVDQQITGVARVAGVPVEVVERILVRDLNRAELFLAGFINGGQ
ncbi:MAG: phage tail assembly protein [Caulobacteraceae bacterium]